jgi:hypothetical protein
LILFEDGKEISRFPLAADDKNAKNYGNVSNYKEKELIKYFDLDKRYLATRAEDSAVTEKKKAAT